MFDIKLGIASLKKPLVSTEVVMLSLLWALISSDRKLAALDSESEFDPGLASFYHNGSTSLSFDCIAEF